MASQTLDSSICNPVFRTKAYLKARQYSMSRGVWLQVSLMTIDYTGARGYRALLVGVAVHPLVNTADSEGMRLVNHGLFEVPLYSGKCVTEDSTFEEFLEALE